MPISAPKLVAATAMTACLVTAAATYLLQTRRRAKHDPTDDTLDIATVRQSLPKDLPSWRFIDASSAVKHDIDVTLWKPLHPFFNARGYTFWLPLRDSYMALPLGVDVVSNGAAYAPLSRGMDKDSPMQGLYRFSYLNPLCQAAQTSDGRSVVIRVLAIGEQGRDTIEILRTVSRGAYSLATWNHAIPLLELLDFDDITFGVFPKIGSVVFAAYGFWPQNSVGDILDMIMQCLEALGFLHDVGIAHCDAFKDNFLVEWHPESLRIGLMPVSRPRVYLNDFETAVRFLPDVPPEKRVCVGLPVGASFPNPERYSRPIPPEVEGDKPYDPFKLDVWQFGTSLAGFKSNVPPIDELLSSLRNPDASMRPSAYEALSTMASIVGSIPPNALGGRPEVAPEFGIVVHDDSVDRSSCSI
ncbi:hypothetical protein BD413DRAFT_570094 [Trametes elegans]|nr:hypothetical protein BD413DRAFT_570094 [Trametes elegans]